MSDIRLKKITVEPLQSPLVIQYGNVHITNTTSSDSLLTGSLILNGGISINASHDSTSSTSGGCISIGGGMSVYRTIQIGKHLILDSSDGVLQVNGISTNRFFVDTVTNKYSYIAPDGVNKRLELYDTYIQLNVTKESSNSSTGGLVVFGGISISNTTESLSNTFGGALSISGGASIEKTLYIGKGLTSVNNNTIGNIFTTGGNVGITNTSPQFTLDVTGTGRFTNGLTTSNLFVTNISSNGLFVTNLTASNIFGTSSTIVSSIFTNVTSSTINVSTGITTNSLIIPSNVDTASDNLIVSNSNTGGTAHTRMYLNNDINNKLSLYLNSSNRTNDGGVNSGTLKNDSGCLGIVASNTILFLTTSGNIGIQTTSPITTLDVNGSARILNNLTSGTLFTTNITTASILVHNGLNANFNSNTIGSIFTTGGNIGINTSAPTYILDIKGTTRIQNDTNSENGLYVRNTNTGGSAYSFVTIQNDTNDSFTLFLNNSTNNNTATMRNNAGSVSLASKQDAAFIHLSTSGNIGINTSVPDYTLDILGTVNVSQVLNISSTTQSVNSSHGALILRNGGLSINGTSDAISLTQGGGITCTGGMSILKTVYLGGRVYIKDTTPSTSYSTAAMQLAGGLSISCPENVNNIGNGGALTVQGGAAFGSDVYVAGQINGSGSSSSTFAYLTLTATDEAINLSSGTLVTFGGITIQCTTNATSVTNGGSLLVNGGGSFASDVYIGGSTNFYDTMNTFIPNNTIINLYDTLQIKRFSIDLDTSSKNFSVSRYDSLGDFVEKTFDISNSDGSITFNNTNPSASIYFKGGLSIECTHNALSVTNGGSLTVNGGSSFRKNVLIGGDVVIHSTTQSNDVSTGSLLVKGGIGVSGNVNVLGNTVLNGDLIVKGATTSVISNNTNIGDNVLVLNSGPSGSKDSGVVIQRFQTDNDTGSGDVVNDTLYISDTLPIQTGISNTEIKLSNLTNSNNDYYTGWWIKVASGFSNNQVRKIITYDGTSRIATLSSPWTNQNPSNGDIVYLYNKPYVGLIYNEINDRFEFGAIVGDPGQTSTTFTDRLPLYLYNLTCTSTAPSSSITTGSLFSSGGISISNTTDASSVTSGGTLTSLGGASIGKTLYVGNALHVNSVNMTPNSQDRFSTVTFNAQNNMNTFTDITNLVFDNNTWGFDIYLTARLNSNSDLYTNYHLRGVNKSSSWELTKTYVGDDIGIEFSITNSGQVQYTSQNYSGFTSLVFK